jgi:hypothetical protein
MEQLCDPHSGEEDSRQVVAERMAPFHQRQNQHPGADQGQDETDDRPRRDGGRLDAAADQESERNLSRNPDEKISEVERPKAI